MSEKQFIVTGHFEKRSLRLGTYMADCPIHAIIAAKEKEGSSVAERFNCKVDELTWEVEEDFL